MPFAVPTFAQIRSRYVQAIANQWPDAAIGPDSDHFVRATAIAAVLEGVYAHQAWVARQAFPDLADADLMEKMANQRGIFRKAAVEASGTIRFSGTVGTAIAIGQQAFTAQGVYYATTAAGSVGGGGTVDLPASAVGVGAAGNLSPTTALTVVAAPAGLTGTALAVSMTSGADVESDESLLERLLLWLSEEAQGGNVVDYIRWTLSIPGAVRAFVYDCRRGAGTVDVVPLPVSGMPSLDLLAAVQEKLNVMRPVGMRNTSPVLALAPSAVPVAVAGVMSLASGYTLASLLPDLTAAIDAVFTALAPGATLVRNELITAIMNVPGVTDVTLTSPAANVTCSINATTLQRVVRGTLTLT